MTIIKPSPHSAKKLPIPTNLKFDQLNFRRSELMNACPLPVLTGENGRITLKIHSDKG